MSAVFDEYGRYLGEDCSCLHGHHILGDAQPTNPIQEMNASDCPPGQVLVDQDMMGFPVSPYCVDSGQGAIDTTRQAIGQTASNVAAAIEAPFQAIGSAASSAFSSLSGSIANIAKWVAIGAAIYFAYQAMNVRKHHGD